MAKSTTTTMKLDQAYSDGRVVQGWALGKTLGKGGYSWVKAGRHVETGKMYALKFLGKETKSRQAEEQTQQVQTEIEVLKRVNHKNIIKLYAYNLNCPYTKSDGKIVDTIMLVLEMAPCGELFDILFYTKALPEILARTYFFQLLGALEHLHAKGVTHRDLKPQNMLLDENYNLKVTDFGLSKVHTSNNRVMSTTYVGTKGYQAPELLMNRRYTNAMDIFSCGVILFIMLTGYPPFEQSDPQKDNWYKYIATERYEKFWKKHRDCGVPTAARHIIQRMVCYQPLKRAKMKEIFDDDWVKGEKLQGAALVKGVTDVHSRACEAKKKDKRKQEMLQYSNRRALNPEIPLLTMADVTDAQMTTLVLAKDDPLEINTKADMFLLGMKKLLFDEKDNPMKERGFTGKDHNEEPFHFVADKCEIDEKGCIATADLKWNEEKECTLMVMCKIRKNLAGKILAIFPRPNDHTRMFAAVYNELHFQLKEHVAAVAGPEDLKVQVVKKIESEEDRLMKSIAGFALKSRGRGFDKDIDALLGQRLPEMSNEKKDAESE